MQTETLDKLYLEWSQFTEARTSREIELEKKVAFYRCCMLCGEVGEYPITTTGAK